MIICPKCQRQNPLGRVFCVQCGSRLDLSAMTSVRVQEELRQSWLERHWRKLAIFGLLIPIALVVAALIAKVEPLGEKGTRVGAERVIANLSAPDVLKAGQSMGISFEEKDINAYFEHVKTRELGVSSISVAFGDGYFNVRVVRQIMSVKRLKFVVQLALSYDLMCIPSESGLFVYRASIGHLSLPGPTKRLAIAPVLGILARDSRLSGLASSIIEIKAQPGKLSVVVKKK